jgi:hypothetical protein
MRLDDESWLRLGESFASRIRLYPVIGRYEPCG